MIFFLIEIFLKQAFMLYSTKADNEVVPTLEENWTVLEIFVIDSKAKYFVV